MKTNLQRTIEGMIFKNPVFFLMLGMCPTLAVTTSIENAVAMGLATTFVLISSNLIISLIRNYIPEGIRIPSFIVVIATFVTIINLLMQAYIPILHKQLGVYVLLIVVNCIVLGRALAFAYKNKPIPAVFDGFGMGLGFTFALILIGGVRELLGTGMITLGETTLSLFPDYAVSMMILPPGALLTVGLILAAINASKNKTGDSR